ncbi:C4-dicarboxylic acid transporter DauA [Saccharophagus sp. K07]|mgnify:CR=1 FL=1|uniref:C4-dicarboxylic acid transporter DauA n=1 Tax=Saccharophagus sp. K07 TaxID=2283636 RepID=UPI00165246B6|nr:C4-dicarboxylic acid transporter DauA [Saccharophagus sp. K07]MBC6906987.1 C4-dicarboxylic acid transporter DauA [Saccharophagus sp. K07]
MPHRSHLFSLRFAHALRESCVASPYSLQSFSRDLMAGITVGIIAIPLAMALAIASGVAPQHGLYTSIIAGFIIALAGGSRLSISGPTAAFVVILYPVVQKHGLGGLLLATLMAGAIMVAMAYARLGRLIEYVPESVTLGFTGGIAVVIATLQIKDFAGLPIDSMPEHFTEKLAILAEHIPDASWPALFIGGLTLTVMFLWPKLRTPIPPHLPAVLAASLCAWLLQKFGFPVDTIATRFSYMSSEGLQAGIPPYPPTFSWPWQQPGPGGAPLSISWPMIVELLPSSFAIAMLGAIESLLCAVILDGMTGRRHSANSELLGQGIGNLIVPFFGGITATAALARSVANLRAGGRTPVAAMIHAVVVLLGLVALAPALSHLPMAGMAALLLVVAWNMSEFPKSAHFVRAAPRSDVLVLLTCLALTIFFDMVIAITAGILLAAVLFMKEIAALTRLEDLTASKTPPEGWKVFRIRGPLFFAAADRVFSELAFLVADAKGLVLELEDVTLLDAGGLAALTKLIDHCHKSNTPLYLCELQSQPLKTLKRAKLTSIPGEVMFYPTLAQALTDISLNNGSST